MKRTPLKNDPFYLKSCLVDGDRGLIPTFKDNFFSPSCDSFIPLVHADYYNLVSANRPFEKSVSLSSYTYYNVIHLWGRLMSVMHHRRELTFEENNFLGRLEHEDLMMVTEPVNTYLRCLGDFKDTNGTVHKLRVSKPNQHGNFGRIMSTNHNLYEALPAPHIALDRIRWDIQYTLGEGEQIWEIPALRPSNAQAARGLDDDQSTEHDDDDKLAEAGAGLPPIEGVEPTQPESALVSEPATRETHRDMPTANLVGWFPAQKLTSNQLSSLKNLMPGGDFKVAIPELQYVPGLMRHVASNIQVLTNYKTTSALHESSFGSAAQEAFLDIHTIPSAFNRVTFYSDGISSCNCLSRLDVHLASGMHILGLRIKKNKLGDKHPWACYDFGQYKHVPAEWIANRNNLFAKGLEIQAYDQFSTVIANRCQFRDQFLRAAIVKTNRS